MDAAIFAGSFLVIDTSNTAVELDVSRDRALATAGDRPTVGHLRPDWVAVDVDPADSDAAAESGEAVAEQLHAWLVDHGCPHVIRASGRPGGRHVVARIRADLATRFHEFTSAISVHHEVPATVRRSLRLLQSPHRWGLPAPVLAVHVTDAELPPLASAAAQCAPVREERRRRRRTSAPGVDRSRREFGDALARARAGWTREQVYADIASVGSKAREQGERDWTRWTWAKVATIVSAEHGESENEAWTRWQRHCPDRARTLGRAEWRRRYWQPACADAGSDRPRRTALDPADTTPRRDTASAEEVAAIRHCLLSALDGHRLRPQFARSAAAVLYAVAEAIGTKDGAISQRTLCARAHVARDTARRVLCWADEAGLLTRVDRYAGGSRGSDRWALGPVVEPRAGQSWSTRYTTPAQPPLGRACPVKSSRAYGRERRAWRARCAALAESEASRVPLRQLDTPAARTARSLHHQRRWWTSLDPLEQARRRHERRHVVAGLHPSRRRAWFDWLADRADLVEIVESERAERPDGRAALAAAPVLVHRGLRALDERHERGRQLTFDAA